MRKLLILIVAAALFWSIYWVVGSIGAQKGFEAWFENRRAEGWVAEYSEFSLWGFPNRFDATFTDIALADPGTGLAWEAPFFQILALSYSPNHVIAVWPNNQLIATPQDKFDLTSSKMRASLVVKPDTALALDRMTLTAETIKIEAQSGRSPTSVANLRLAAEQLAEGDEPRYRLGLAADGLVPGTDWQRRFDPDNTLPDTLQPVSVDMTVLFDKAWDMSAIEDARPQPREIELTLAEARWGQLALAAAGSLEVDEAGQPTGTITVKARNWRDILDLVRNSGSLPETMIQPIEDGLGLMAQLSGNPKTLDIPLKFSGGRIWLGPVPIAPAPELRLR